MNRPCPAAEPEVEPAVRARVQQGRIGRPDYVVRVVLRLLAPDDEWVAGSVITVVGALDVAP